MQTFRIEHSHPEKLNELELASEYLEATKKMSRSAFPTFLFGLVNIVFALRSPSPSAYDVGLFLDGLGLIAVGIYVMRSPTPVAMLINALLLWGSSVWYMFGWHNVLALLGLFGIWHGGREFNRWRRFRGHFHSREDAIVREASEIVGALQAAVPAQSSHSLELYVSGDRWTGMFSDSVVAFLSPDRRLFLCNSPNLHIQQQGGTLVGGFRKLLIRVSSAKTVKATITEEYLERLRGWSAGTTGSFPRRDEQCHSKHTVM